MNFLPNRREILFLYDIKMGNPNGDPDENRPRRLPEGRFYVTDVRLKRFVRDYVLSQGQDILVSNIEGRTTNLTGRVVHHLKNIGKTEANGKELIEILLDSFIDARLFGSSFAFKGTEKEGTESDEESAEEDLLGGKKKTSKKSGKKEGDWKLKPIPKTLTGAVQFNMGEVLNDAEEIIIPGTTTFGSDEEKGAGTFTEISALRYGLIAFNGVANQHSAKLSHLTESDYETLLKALWNGVRNANTRSKVGQVPRLLISVEYKAGEEFQFGNLVDYVELLGKNDQKPEKTWSSPQDYTLDLTQLLERLKGQKKRIQTVRYETSPDMNFDPIIPTDWQPLQFD